MRKYRSNTSAAPRVNLEHEQTEMESYRYRDEWIADLLADLELSPAARLVGVSLGLAVSFVDWPSIRSRAYGGHLRVLAARLGLPLAIVADACNALMRRGRLRPWIENRQLRGFDLCDRANLRSEVRP